MMLNYLVDRGQLFDANGFQIRFWFEADTDTGVVCQVAVDEEGRPIRFGPSYRGEEVRHPAPLLFKGERFS